MESLRDLLDALIQLLPRDVLNFLRKPEARWGGVGVLWLLLAYRLFGKVTGARHGWMGWLDWVILGSVVAGMWMIYTGGERSW